MFFVCHRQTEKRKEEKIQVSVLEFNSKSSKCIETIIGSRVNMHTTEKHEQKQKNTTKMRTTSIKSIKVSVAGQGKSG